MSRKSVLWVIPFMPLLLASPPALADGTVEHPGDHPHYVAEIEPHVLLREDNYFAAGVGLGARASFPIVDPGFIKGINDTIALGVGLDVFLLSDCYYQNQTGCRETAFGIPLVMQWNFYVTPRISVFGEPGVELYFYDFNGCPAGVACGGYERTHFAPFTFNAGMRYHFSESVAITPRIGVDNYGAFIVSVGVSFFAGRK
jgi:hypothetical protein